MNIGIDFDNTIVNTSEVSKQFLDIYKPGNKLKSYHDLPLNEEIDFFSKYHFDITKKLQLLPDVKEAFAFFRQNGFKLYLITARGADTNNQEEMIKTVKAFLKTNGIVFDGEIYLQKRKINACTDNNIGIMIDDTENVLDDLNSSGIRVLKYGSISNKYDYALNWQEVIDYFRKEFKCE